MIYEVVSRRIQVDKKGNDRSVTEKYLINNCMLCSEAEEKILGYFNNENDCISVKVANLSEFINNRGDEDDSIYFSSIEIYCEGTKAASYTLGVFACSVEDATEKTNKFLKESLEDYVIVSVKRTRYVEFL